MERENHELRQANEILRKASAYFAQAELDRRCEAMIAFIDDHREAYGVEPICTSSQVLRSRIEYFQDTRGRQRSRGGRQGLTASPRDSAEIRWLCRKLY